LLDSSGES